jgi:hypothetical protein
MQLWLGIYCRRDEFSRRKTPAKINARWKKENVSVVKGSGSRHAQDGKENES